VIVGRAGNGDVLRLEGFCAATAIPVKARSRDDPQAKALIERFHVDPGELPIVLCPGESCCAIRARTSCRLHWARGPIDPTASTTLRRRCSLLPV